MSRFRYYQPNDKDIKDKTGDCQVRALSKIFNISWLEAFDLTIPICRKLQTYTIFDSNPEVTKTAMQELGFKYYGISNKKESKRPTVDGFAREHKKGKYILSLARHVVAVVDGCYFDTWDCGKKSLYGYYELIPASKRLIEESGFTKEDISTIKKAISISSLYDSDMIDVSR